MARNASMRSTIRRGAQIMLFEDLEVLIVLSEAKSLSQAAERLYMSRQGLNQRIANLEHRLGTTLYNRTSTGISMTPAGELVTKFAKNTAEREEVLNMHLAAISESFNSNLDIGMSLNDGVALLPRLVAGFHEENPKAMVHLEADYEPGLVQGLKSGKIDLAILENQPDEPGLINEVLGHSKLVWIAPNKPPYNQIIHPLPVKTLLTWPMIIYEWNSGRHMVGNMRFRERYGISLLDHNMVARFDTHEAMVEGVKAGLGWATIPECIYARYRNDPDIVRFKVDTGPMWYPVSLAWSSERIQSDLARRFIEYLKAHLPQDYFTADREE